MRAERWTLPLAVAGIGLVMTLLAPRSVALGWLVAAFLASGVAAGSIALTLMMRLIDGRWRTTLRLDAGTATLPIAIAAAVPVGAAIHVLYPWFAAPEAGFRGVWLSPVGFAIRAVLWFAMLIALVRRPTVAGAVLGLIAIPLLGSLIAVDWLMSLDPGFHSSGFGLQALAVQFSLALAVAVLRLPDDPSGANGALMLTLAMLWCYFGYLQFFIIWSSNFPSEAHWYLVRAGGWAWVEGAAVALHAAPLLALLSGRVRRSGPVLRWLAGAVIAGEVLHVVWLVQPGAIGAIVAVPVVGAATWRAGRWA